jgi:hypothetical protein
MREPYWTAVTLRELAVRYPGLDTRPWQPERQDNLADGR